MGGAVLKSVLESVVNQYAGKSFKKQSVVNALKNRGVKDAELKDSGVLKFIDQTETDKVQIDDLAKILNNREDLIKMKSPKWYRFWTISTPQDRAFGNKSISRYTEDVYIKKSPKSEQVKSHYGDILSGRHYYGHTRGFVNRMTYVDNEFKSIYGIGPRDLGSTKVKRYHPIEIVTEIQSDKHSPGLKKSFNYKPKNIGTNPAVDETPLILDKELAKIIEESSSIANPGEITAFWQKFKSTALVPLNNFTVKDFRQLLNKPRVTKKIKQIYAPKEKYLVNLIAERKRVHNKWSKDMHAERYKEARVFEKDPRYVQNIINNKLVDSHNRGIQAVIFRIGNHPNLHRSDKSQKLYTTIIAPSLIKTANKIGAKIYKNKNYITLVLPAAGFVLPVYAGDTNKLNVIGTKNLIRTDKEKQ